MPRALLYYLAQAWTADRHRQAQRDAPARAASRAPSPRPSPRAPRAGGPPNRCGAHRTQRQPITRIPRPGTRSGVTPRGTAPDLVPAPPADAQLRTAKASQPDGTGQVCAAATKERSNRR